MEGFLRGIRTFSSDNILIKGSNVDLLMVMIIMSGHLKGSVDMMGNVGVVGFRVMPQKLTSRP